MPMLIQKAGEELLSSGLRGGVGGSPDFLAAPTASPAALLA
jgi:hypothetical protein